MALHCNSRFCIFVVILFYILYSNIYFFLLLYVKYYIKSRISHCSQPLRGKIPFYMKNVFAMRFYVCILCKWLKAFEEEKKIFSRNEDARASEYLRLRWDSIRRWKNQFYIFSWYHFGLTSYILWGLDVYDALIKNSGKCFEYQNHPRWRIL